MAAFSVAAAVLVAPAATAAPQCVQVTGVKMRADGILIGLLSGFVAMPGLQQIPPATELACPAGHVVVGLNADEGQLFAACRRLFSNEPAVMSQASVAITAGHPDRACAAGQSVIGLRRVNGLLDVVCR